tara:strand:- start:1668 stop:1958 length:291 start_codon:yes stop_codon:yes gene_type:complete
MGADVFMITATGVSAGDAFSNARQDALYCSGHGGYTGTIAEKDSFDVVALKEGHHPRDYANKLIDDRDPRISDKWGPAGCFDLGGGRYFFFGLASS